jgi:hypothetical protein
MVKSGVLAAAAMMLGFGSHAFGACQVIWNNYTMPGNKTGCYEIWGSNITFNGNGYKVTGSGAEGSNTIIAIKGYNVTVKNVEINCNTKLTGVDMTNNGTSKAMDMRISNCYYGVWRKNTNASVTGKLDGGSTFMNNTFDVLGSDGSNTTVYTYDLDANSNGYGYGVFAASCPLYDSKSIIYLKNFGMIGASNTFFWLYKTFFFANSHHDLYINAVPAAYLQGVNLGSYQKGLLNIDSKVIYIN